MWLQPLALAEEQAAYFASIGRAMGLAQNFEQNCKFVFGIWDLGEAYEQKKIATRDERRAYASKLMKRMLGAAVRQRESDPLISNDEFAALEAARNARNYLAHEAAEAGLYVPPRFGRHKLGEILAGNLDRAAIEAERREMLLAFMRERIPRFVDCVRALGRADNIVSGWSYVIQEKDHALPSLGDRHAQLVVDWVLEPLRIAGVIEGPRS